MLPDFPLAVRVGGEPYVVVARDVPTALFFQGHPNTVPGARCYVQAGPDGRRVEYDRYALWVYSLPTKVVAAPRLDAELTARLGWGLLELGLGYLRRVGWVTDADLEREAQRPGAVGEAARRYLEERRLLDSEPLPPPPPQPPWTVGEAVAPYPVEAATNVKLAVREVARRAKCRFSTLWQGPVSEFIMDWRMYMDPDLQDEPDEDDEGAAALAAGLLGAR